MEVLRSRRRTFANSIHPNQHKFKGLLDWILYGVGAVFDSWLSQTVKKRGENLRKLTWISKMTPCLKGGIYIFKRHHIFGIYVKFHGGVKIRDFFVGSYYTPWKFAVCTYKEAAFPNQRGSSIQVSFVLGDTHPPNQKHKGHFRCGQYDLFQRNISCLVKYPWFSQIGFW